MTDRNQKSKLTKRESAHAPKYVRAHDDLIVEIMARGGTLAEFCTHKTVLCGRSTVYNWYNRFDTFRYAYDLARECAKRYHEKTVSDNLLVEKDAETTFDTSTFMKLHSIRFSGMHSENPILEIIDDKDLMRSVKNLATAAAKNVITAEQVRNISMLLQQATQIKEQDEIVKRLERLETNEDDES